eukprot:GFUD01014736.1.p1 GENE.GFUD01014736.1~~GFUD01014736.1.p1  ORF type:complete len:255 (-),score=67.80 GFUD01014736.1:755-1519(-)
MSDSEFLEGDIVDNMFGMKGTSAHLEMDFLAATKFVRGLAGTAKHEDLLYFYARYKQASVGKCNTTKPSFYQLTEKSKWSAWTDLGEMGRVEAQLQYIQRLTELEPNWQELEANEPTEGWVSVSSPLREPALSPGEETIWDYVKEGRAEPLNQLPLPLTTMIDQDGLTLLHWASDRGHTDIARLLLNRDKDLLDMQDSDGQTALHYAASCGHKELVIMLLEFGADMGVLDSDGVSPCNADTDSEIRALFRGKKD